jgi:hypothetical protein
MPPLLAPLVGREYGGGAAGGGGAGAGPLQRSKSSAAVPTGGGAGEKGGFLAKTKSILRKRSSATGIKTHADGGISFAPRGGGLPDVGEERDVEGGGVGRLGKRLSKRK